MQEKKKPENRLARRVKYEAPRVWCLPMEAEGIIAFSGGGPNFGGSTGDGTGANTINKQETGFLQSPSPGFMNSGISGPATLESVETEIF